VKQSAKRTLKTVATRLDDAVLNHRHEHAAGTAVHLKYHGFDLEVPANFCY
jgi:hypothetical protein